MAQPKLCGLTPMQAKVLSSLAARNVTGGRLSLPRSAADIGASRESPHYAALKSLCTRGFADKMAPAQGSQPVYQLTQDGVGMLDLLEELVQIPAALVQGPKAATLRRLEPFAFLRREKK